MAISLYMDQHVPHPITEQLRRRGVDVLTVQDDDMSKADDDEIIERATQLGRVAFTMDDDFYRESAKLQREGIQFSGVIYAHQLGVSIGDCVRDLHIACEAGMPEDFANLIERLPL
jgi:hypothetical protein